ncbi:thioredoxin family protein [Akkermansiaceae bacterium]|nr:thioredoxin family protein [Akkermansiaceae bacterium]
MNYKLNLAMVATAILSGSTLAHAGGEGWSSDFAASAKLAAAENKVMLVDFTGSDWCGWCIKLDKEVFSHDEFKNGVKDGFVLVELDYPRDKSKLSPETIAQNEELKGKYAIRGYPTILLMDGEGRPFAKTGYQAGGPEKYVTHLNELTERKKLRDEAFASAEKLEGVEKAKALVAALKAIGLDEAMLGAFYGEQIEAIKKADPKDESGFAKGIALKAKMADFEKELNALASQQKFEEAQELVAKNIASGDFEGPMLQQLVFVEGMIHAQLGDLDKALVSLDKADAVVPGSPMAKRIAAIKAKITQDMEAKKAEGDKAEEE